MGILKKVGVSVGCLLFTTFIALSIVSIAVVDITSYDSLQPLFSDIIKSSIGDVDPVSMDVMLDTLRQQCQGQDKIEFPQGDTTIMIECSDIMEEGADVRDIIATSMFDELYYKQYECGFIECLTSGEFTVIASAQGNSFFQNTQIIFIAVSALGAAMIIAFTETWPGRLKTLGIQMIFIGIAYFLIDIVIPMVLPNFVPTTEMGAVTQAMSLVDSITQNMKMYFLCFFIAGVVLTAAGYAWGYMENKKKGVKQLKSKPKK
jgi:hypothetical protein